MLFTLEHFLVQEKSRISLSLFSVDIDLGKNPSRIYPKGFCLFVHPQHELCYKQFTAEYAVIHICPRCNTDEECNTAQLGDTSQIASFLLPLNLKRASKFSVKRTSHIFWHCSSIFETTVGAVCTQLMFLSFFFSTLKAQGCNRNMTEKILISSCASSSCRSRRTTLCLTLPLPN